jgi:exopolyphosphatase/guanosine-5'-triphosphate,3'-diphosphate pyrophosphatase
MPDGAALTGIVPRWEWRTFGPDLDRLGDVEAVFASLATSEPLESDETYILAGTGRPVDHVVKVRGGLLDIKRLGAVDATGLERWAPVHKAAFPLTPGDVAAAWEALGLTGATPPGPVADEAALASVLAAASTDVRVVLVHKRRVRGTLDGVAVELSEVSAAGRSTRTVAAESTDAAAVGAVEERLGLDGFVNTSYPVGLAELLTDRPPRYAVIDVGTNSVKFYLAERDPDGAWRPIVDRAEVTRLGEGIQETGDIAPAAVDRTRDAIDGMVREAREAGALAILAVGTAGLRAAGNRDAVVEAFRERTGITVRVIGGEDEARLAYQATVAALGPHASAAAVFDTGGGSTQFTFGHDGRIDAQTSVPLGAVGLTDRFGLDGPVDATTIAAAREAVADAFALLRDRPRLSGLVGMGGAVTNLAAVHHGLAVYDPTIIFGTVLDRAAVDQQIATYRGLDAAGRRSIVGLQPARAEVILAGACIVRTIMDLLDQPSVTVSDRGLRHGLLAERFEPRRR